MCTTKGVFEPAISAIQKHCNIIIDFSSMKQIIYIKTLHDHVNNFKQIVATLSTRYPIVSNLRQCAIMIHNIMM